MDLRKKGMMNSWGLEQKIQQIVGHRKKSITNICDLAKKYYKQLNLSRANTWK